MLLLCTTSILVRSEIALVGTKTGPRGFDLSNPFEKHHWDWANCETRCETSCAPVTLRVSVFAANRSAYCNSPGEVVQRPLLAYILGLFANDERQLGLVVRAILVLDRPGNDDRVREWVRQGGGRSKEQDGDGGDREVDLLRVRGVLCVSSTWGCTLSKTHVEPDAPDRAYFLPRQRAQQPSNHDLTAGGLARREDALPVIYIHLDLLSVVRRQPDVDVRIDRFADDGRGALVGDEPDESGHGVYVSEC